MVSFVLLSEMMVSIRSDLSCQELAHAGVKAADTVQIRRSQRFRAIISFLPRVLFSLLK